MFYKIITFILISIISFCNVSHSKKLQDKYRSYTEYINNENIPLVIKSFCNKYPDEILAYENNIESLSLNVKFCLGIYYWNKKMDKSIEIFYNTIPFIINNDLSEAVFKLIEDSCNLNNPSACRMLAFFKAKEKKIMEANKIYNKDILKNDELAQKEYAVFLEKIVGTIESLEKAMQINKKLFGSNNDAIISNARYNYSKLPLYKSMILFSDILHVSGRGGLEKLSQGERDCLDKRARFAKDLNKELVPIELRDLYDKFFNQSSDDRDSILMELLRQFRYYDLNTNYLESGCFKK